MGERERERGQTEGVSTRLCSHCGGGRSTWTFKTQLGLNEAQVRLDGSSDRNSCTMETFARHCFVWMLLEGIFCLVSKRSVLN